ncbi:MAG: DUF1549 domain-containing protein, partial [Planctomycetales bacterium]|nr:DUF1549 domain-containing protein [Planctomycetales bacterium]
MVAPNFHHSYWAVFAMFIVATGFSPTAGDENNRSPEQDKNAKRDFTLDVLPLLTSKCFGCHGEDPDDVKGEYDLRSLDGMLRGGESGEPSIVVGNPEESTLVQAIKWDGLEMPPKENDRLDDAQIASIEAWVRAGAPWPTSAEQKAFRDAAAKLVLTDDGVIVSTSGGQSADWTNRRYKPEDIWAFQPLVKVQQQFDVTEDGRAGAVHPIDFFVQRKLKDAGFTPAESASPEVLLRRAMYDLAGLPPTPEQTAEFLNAWQKDSDAAWDNLISALLESPHYGERSAQHWLDVVRYADTGGYSNDYERSNAWRYRDYVIRSFNQDKPYDQFVIEQLAGDELADESVRERLGDDAVHATRLSGDYTEQESEWIVATGFLRMGPWDNAMVKAPEARQIFLDDVVNSFGQTF